MAEILNLPRAESPIELDEIVDYSLRYINARDYD